MSVTAGPGISRPGSAPGSACPSIGANPSGRPDERMITDLCEAVENANPLYWDPGGRRGVVRRSGAPAGVAVGVDASAGVATGSPSPTLRHDRSSCTST